MSDCRRVLFKADSVKCWYERS